VVAVMLPNQVELLLGLMAAWRLGAAATPINPLFTPNEAGYQIQDSGAKLLLTSGPDADYGVPVLTPEELSAAPAGTLPAPDVATDYLALLIYTSGSTSRPKGGMLDHSNLVAILARFAPGTFLDAIAKYRATYFSAVPTIYARPAELPDDVKPDTSSVQFAVCGAAPMSKELPQRSESRFAREMQFERGLLGASAAQSSGPLYAAPIRSIWGVLPAWAGVDEVDGERYSAAPYRRKRTSSRRARWRGSAPSSRFR
jgi:acyl-CoA synthetase (AMP-forming)/AMP-acid ligase II